MSTGQLGEAEFFCWLYDSELVRRGLTHEFCKAMDRDHEWLEWYFAGVWFGVTFACGDTRPKIFRERRNSLARHMGYSD